MKIIFMGTPDFAVHTLNALTASPHEVVAVFTQPDKPRNRGKKVSFSPVKEAALVKNIPVFQPESLKNAEIPPCDCIVVAAYGVLLPESVLSLPKHGCLNVHASLLPKYRGAAPINRAIMNGETKSGITIMQMDKGLDTGNMLLKKEVKITPSMSATELHDSLAQVGGKLLVEALDSIGSLTPTEQDSSQSTHAAKLSKAECELDLSKTAAELLNHIRGLADYPCAFTRYGDKRIKIYRAVSGNVADGIPIVCGDGQTLTLTEIQPENGKRMNSKEFLMGIKNSNTNRKDIIQ
jgi:methionyl-tRNA formyltransferase